MIVVYSTHVQSFVYRYVPSSSALPRYGGLEGGRLDNNNKSSFTPFSHTLYPIFFILHTIITWNVRDHNG